MAESLNRETLPLREDLTPEEVEEFIEELLKKLVDDPSWQEEAARASGLDLAKVRAALSSSQPLVSIRPAGAGLTGAEVAIIVAFAPLVVHVGKSVWDHFLLPR